MRTIPRDLKELEGKTLTIARRGIKDSNVRLIVKSGELWYQPEALVKGLTRRNLTPDNPGEILIPEPRRIDLADAASMRPATPAEQEGWRGHFVLEV